MLFVLPGEVGEEIKPEDEPATAAGFSLVELTKILWRADHCSSKGQHFEYDTRETHEKC